MLSKNFLFGAATAAYQAEGATDEQGRGETLWDEYYHSPLAQFNADQASDFYHLYPLDLKMGVKYHLNSIRISIAWSRIFPDNTGNPSQTGINFYHKLIDECFKQGVEPLVTLHHFDSPKWIFDKGDFVNREVIEDYLKFAEFCFKEYGMQVKKWATFNETYVYASDKFIYGEEPPFAKFRLDLAIQQMYHMSIAHARAVEMYKHMNLPGEIGIVHVLQPRYPYDKTSMQDQKAAQHATAWYSQHLLDCNYKGGIQESTLDIINSILKNYNYKLKTEAIDMTYFKAAQGKTDFLGINYYDPGWYQACDDDSQIKHNSGGEKGTSRFVIKGIGASLTPKDIPTNDWDWAIYPEGLYDMLTWVKTNYPNYKKIYITENGIGYKETLDENNKVWDWYRIDYLAGHVKSVERAIEAGVNVQGYYVWSWMDVFSWTNGYAKRYGLFFVDYSTQRRYPKLSALWYCALTKQLSVDKIDCKQIESEYAKLSLK